MEPRLNCLHLLSINDSFVTNYFVDATLYRAPFWNTQASDELPDFMNGPIRNVLGIIPPEITWHTSKLSAELMMFSYIHA